MTNYFYISYLVPVDFVQNSLNYACNRVHLIIILRGCHEGEININ